jgi:hypothetical protein
MAFDLKYGRVTTEHGDIPDDEPVIVFRARDAFVPRLLEFYAAACADGGSPQRHLDLIAGTKAAVKAWQREHPDRVRTPDSERSREWLAGEPAARQADDG